MTERQPFNYFGCLTSTPKIIRWALIMSVRFQLSPRNVGECMY